MAIRRVRMKTKEGDQTALAWDRGEVGVWYGGWSADDLAAASSTEKPWEALSESVNHRRHFTWSVSPNYYRTALRFASITPDDWVLVVARGQIHLGRLVGPVESDEAHPLNFEGQLLKFRRVTQQKAFPLAQLPEVYALVPQAGLGNVFQFGDLGHLVAWLADARDAGEVCQRLAALPLAEFIAALGPRGWESIAEAYLILEEGYVPVGLTVGGTLKTFDLLGRSLRDGARLVAQCKNARHVVSVDAEFLDRLSDSAGGMRAYYFAYGGCTGAPADVRVVTGADIVRWLETNESGKRYLDVLR